MDNYEYTELLKKLNKKLSNIESILKPNEVQKRLDEITELEQAPNFWDDIENATKLGQEKIDFLEENLNLKKQMVL